MKSHSLSAKGIAFLISIIIQVVSAQAQAGTNPGRTGWWNFNNTIDLLAPVPGYGLPLILTGDHQQVEGPAVNDYAVKIGTGSYYKMIHQIPANGGGNYVNEYTLQVDFKVESINVWHCFFQTNTQNANDGDCFINPQGRIGVGATGYSSSALEANEWYRLVVSVDNSKAYNYYIDGFQILTGIPQTIDDRFSLEEVLLMFADNDGEDNAIIVSEIAIWDCPLSESEVSELGGFGHAPNLSLPLIAYPFLQTLTSGSVYVCWHDTLTSVTRVEYGLTEELGSYETGSSESLSPVHRWHTVKLTGLMPDTKYYYRILTGSDTTAVYYFNTQPDASYNGHIRFLLFSDTQEDSAWTGRLVREARQKVMELYEGDIGKNINVMVHTGDIVSSGSDISHWTDQFMRPFAPLTASIPFLSVAGNHEEEHSNYYTYMKYDDISGFPPSHGLFEKVWAYHLPRVLLIGLNTNMITQYGQTMRLWLDSQLAEAENDPAIDFVFCFLHHPPVSELWGEGNTTYVENEILNTLKKYSKVQQLSYGHTHAYERGVIESAAVNSNGDFRISCVGGGGGARDRWGVYTNFNYPQIHIALDHYFYILYDIDLASKSYYGTMFDFGNNDVPMNGIVSDTWHRNLNQSPPDKPVALYTALSPNKNVVLHASNFTGEDTLMSSHFQITATPGDFSNPLYSSIRNWQDIYGVDATFHPVDINAGIDLSSLEVPASTLPFDSTLAFRVRYRDQNLKWSEWSDELQFQYTDTTGIRDTGQVPSGLLKASPNPILHSTEISFRVISNGRVELGIYDLLGNKVKELVNKEMQKGTYSLCLRATDYSPGIYYCRLRVKNNDNILKLVVSR